MRVNKSVNGVTFLTCNVLDRTHRHIKNQTLQHVQYKWQLQYIHLNCDTNEATTTNIISFNPPLLLLLVTN